MKASAEETKDLWLKPIYCSQMSMSSFISCSLLCSSLVSRGVKSPVFVVTPLTWHSTIKLQPWVSGQMRLSHLQAALLVSLSLEDESEQKEEKADFGAQCLHSKYLFSTTCVWKQKRKDSKVFQKPRKKSKYRQEAPLKTTCGPNRSRTGDGYKRLNVYRQFWLMQSARPGSLGDGSSRAASWSAAKMLWKHCFSLSLMTCQDHKRSSGSAGPGAQVLWGQSWRAVRPLFLPKGWQTAAEHQGGFLSFPSPSHP